MTFCGCVMRTTVVPPSTAGTSSSSAASATGRTLGPADLTRRSRWRFPRPSMGDVIDDLNKFLDTEWDPDLTVGDWWEKLGLAGWSAPALPENAYGKGLGRNDAGRVA